MRLQSQQDAQPIVLVCVGQHVVCTLRLGASMPDDNVISLKDARERIHQKSGWVVARRVLCFECGYEWVGVLEYGTKAIKLECPECASCAGVVMMWD